MENLWQNPYYLVCQIYRVKEMRIPCIEFTTIFPFFPVISVKNSGVAGPIDDLVSNANIFAFIDSENN